MRAALPSGLRADPPRAELPVSDWPRASRCGDVPSARRPQPREAASRRTARLAAARRTAAAAWPPASR
nr:unnamed protein product [Digitaria exilis]